MKKTTLLAAFLVAFGMNAQIFQEDFELDLLDSTNFENWDNFDEDGDGQLWEIANVDSFGWTTSMSGNVADSDSWEQAPFNPDNYLITKDPIVLGTNTTIDFTIGTYQTNGTFLGDRLAVYFSATNVPSDIAGLTPLFDQTVGVLCPSTSNSNNTADVPTIDASAFDGQTVYLVFRHFDTFDENSVLVDNIVVDGNLSIANSNISGFNYFYSSQTKNLTLTANDAFSKISVFNVLGQEVIAQKLTSTNEVISLASLKVGVYIANVTANGQTSTFKIVKR